MDNTEKTPQQVRGLSLLLIGCGNMGGALLRGWIASTISSEFSRIDVVKPSVPSADLALGEVTFHHAVEEVAHTPTIIVWGVKPVQLEEVVRVSTSQFGSEPIYVSIAAGKTLANIDVYTDVDIKAVRAMPNTPVAIGEGVTGLCASDNVTDTERLLIEKLFSALGTAVWTQESQMNSLTALCGSGPAYVYYFMECLSQAAAELGLDEEQVDKLTRQMVVGAAGLANLSNESLATLRQNVTSPNGTTEAALRIWMEKGTLDEQSTSALVAAVKRAGELENQ